MEGSRRAFSADFIRTLADDFCLYGRQAIEKVRKHQRTCHLFNKAFLEALAKDFQEGGAQAIAKVRKEQPAAYKKICALLVALGT